jgi:hypothetical protein
VRVGTNNAALAAEQLSAITHDGHHMRLTADGYLAEALKGTLLYIQ